jgi:ATP-binding cassette subfamily B protein
MVGLRFILAVSKYLAPYKRLVLVLLFGLAFEATFETGLRYSLKYIVDVALPAKNLNTLLPLLALLGMGAALCTILCVLCDYLWARAGSLVMNDLKRELYNHLLHHPLELIARRPTGSVMNRFSADAGVVENGLVIALPAGVLALVGIGLAGSLLVHINGFLAALCFLGLVLCFLAPRAAEQPAQRASLRHREVEGEVAGRVQEMLTAQPVIKAFGLEGRLAGRFGQQLQTLLHASVRSSFLRYLVQRLPNLSFLLLQLMVLAVGAALAAVGQLSIGDLVSCQVLLLGLSAAVNNLTWVLPTLIDASASLERILVLLHEKSTLIDPPHPRPLPPMTRGLAFEGVSFGYTSGRMDLHDIDFVLPRGSFTAILGSSGAGKSTLVNLLLRFYDPTRGRVTLDGVDLRDVCQRDFRAQVGVVFQDVVLLDDTIRENIRLGLPDATDAQVEAAARAAEVHEVICRQPQGYDTPVGERGGRLSGGERQRIALARAMIRNPAILILDEATSALDPKTEADIVRTLRRVARGRTVLAITHRPALATHADMQFVLENGRLHPAPVNANPPALVGKEQPMTQLARADVRSKRKRLHRRVAKRRRFGPLTIEGCAASTVFASRSSEGTPRPSPITTSA